MTEASQALMTIGGVIGAGIAAWQAKRAYEKRRRDHAEAAVGDDPGGGERRISLTELSRRVGAIEKKVDTLQRDLGDARSEVHKTLLAVQADLSYLRGRFDEHSTRPPGMRGANGELRRG